MDESTPRKRIAVACGRCRKRKIRCSGETGNGDRCSNCKNANVEQCLFLRSTEAPMRHDPNDFGYNAAEARALQARVYEQPDVRRYWDDFAYPVVWPAPDRLLPTPARAVRPDQQYFEALPEDAGDMGYTFDRRKSAGLSNGHAYVPSASPPHHAPAHLMPELDPHRAAIAARR